ncbi:MAG: hypothetical protein HYY85_15545 [Deltaproteobacteria bacterium]|nr:hypothetical protein [Deltaproteobacteria bacterium]
MCDMHPEMVGTVLTVARVRELNAKDYFYQMLKDNPEITRIYPGIEDGLLQGAIDCHIHAYPDFVHRSQNMIEIAVDAARAGMRALAFKDHYNLTAGCAYLVQQHIDSLVARAELPHRVEVYGGIGTCVGMNPEAVRQALKYPHIKMIWFPTFTSFGFWRGAGGRRGRRRRATSGWWTTAAGSSPRWRRSSGWPPGTGSGSASGTRTSRSCSRWRPRSGSWARARCWTTPSSSSTSSGLTRCGSSRTWGCSSGPTASP